MIEIFCDKCKEYIVPVIKKTIADQTDDDTAKVLLNKKGRRYLIISAIAFCPKCYSPISGL